MEINQLDIEKVNLITVAAQVNSLISLTMHGINKENLITAINSVTRENRANIMYQFLTHALEFYQKIEQELSKEGNENEDQFSFKFNE